MEKVILGLSGGVDSAVSARLLKKQGYEVLGLFLDIGAEAARQDAIAVAEYLGIPLKCLDITAELEKNVCVPFTAAYLRGETPNPCIMCNPTVKFKALCDYADEQGAEYIATGHYALAEKGCIYKGHPQNDQSYMLCRVKREQAARLLLPLGGFAKEHGMTGIKGHRSVGGFRASIYNACPLESVQALVDCMKEFEQLKK